MTDLPVRLDFSKANLTFSVNVLFNFKKQAFLQWAHALGCRNSYFKKIVNSLLVKYKTMLCVWG